MASPYNLLFDHYLSRIDPESAHRRAIHLLRIAQTVPASLRWLAHPPKEDPRLAIRLWGLTFPNPLGIAAGMDKDAEAATALLTLGFGHVEVGTVTPRPQPGNPRPRLWRIMDKRALINALGFPSQGATRVCARLVHRGKRGGGGIVGINIGKNRETPLERTVEDYEQLIESLFDVADYFTINVSSPNTPGLRELQAQHQLTQLVEHARRANDRAAKKAGTAARPLLVKISPDMSEDQLHQAATAAVRAGAQGIVATNTTTNRDGLCGDDAQRPGGLSGAPLFRRSNTVIRQLYQTVGKRVPIIGVGGVASAREVLGHMRAGASLVQMYTGFIYGGPRTASNIVNALSSEADRTGWTNIGEIVGTAEGA